MARGHTTCATNPAPFPRTQLLAASRISVAQGPFPAHIFRHHGALPNGGPAPPYPPQFTMKRSSLSFTLSAALLLLMTSCESGKQSEPAAQAAATPAISGTPSTDGMVSTASGLRYKVLASGPAGGRSPTLYDSVTVHYKGTLTNGTVFDSSYERGAPATFGVNQVIPGWTEALQLMKPGDQWLLYIPANLGYGPQSMGDIPANSDLIFQVHLIQVTGAGA